MLYFTGRIFKVLKNRKSKNLEAYGKKQQGENDVPTLSGILKKTSLEDNKKSVVVQVLLFLIFSYRNSTWYLVTCSEGKQYHWVHLIGTTSTCNDVASIAYLDAGTVILSIHTTAGV